MARKNKDYRIVTHILSYCVDIEDTLDEFARDRTVFDASKTYRNALALCILQIGELVGNLSDEFKSENGEIPWRNIKMMRNIVAHQYGTFDFDILWEVVTGDIRGLKNFCESYLSRNVNL